jgi:hypothetical protein
MYEHPLNSTEDNEISAKEVINFFIDSWKIIAIAGVLGLLSAVVFIYVTPSQYEAAAQIKMAPPQSIKYLYPDYDYENFEFRSPINPWNPQPKFVADFDKIKCLEFTLVPGKTLFLPAYWWYSIKFGKDSSISCFKYRTYINNIAILPYIGLHALQIQNIKRNIAKKVTINELNNTTHVFTNENQNQENILPS